VAITEKLNEAANGTLSWAGEVNSGADWAPRLRAAKAPQVNVRLGWPP
jgi:hypothetical protein